MESRIATAFRMPVRALGIVIPATVANFDRLPDSAMVNVQTIAVVLGKSVSSIWRDSRAGKLPPPIKIGPATTRWNVGAIRRHLASLGVAA